MSLRRVWPLAYNAPKDIPILRFIHPLKQKSVAELIEYAEHKFPDTERLIVFGSSVTEKCHQYSDVDVVVIGSPQFHSPMGDVYDICRVEGCNHNSAFIRRIIEEGVIVYDKNAIT